MAESFETISDKHKNFMEKQPVFFVASATKDSRVNLSPKGLDCFRVLGPNQIAYLDITGSTNETAAHMLADGRITFLFTSFSKTPMNMRLYGKGRAIHEGDEGFDAIAQHFPNHAGLRQFIVADIDLLTTNCGFGVPEMDMVQVRPTLLKWAEKLGADGIKDYQKRKNTRSMDGLPTGIEKD